jgi:ankyrin repeat protein
MHHACALQRIHLVQLYLSCLDFKIESKDCEGNTCLHYVAIAGNCEIAELLIKSAEKMNIYLDQYVNRDGKIHLYDSLVGFPLFRLFRRCSCS